MDVVAHFTARNVFDHQTSGSDNTGIDKLAANPILWLW